MMLLYVVSRNESDGNPWRVVGVFTSLDAAVAECRNKSYGVSPHEIDVAKHDIPAKKQKKGIRARKAGDQRA